MHVPFIVESCDCEKIADRAFIITSRHRHPQSNSRTGPLFKNHPRPSALASTRFLSFGARCRSGARGGNGLLEARLPRARPFEVRRAVGLGCSFVRQLWRPLSAGATRPAANIIICHLASSLSRGCPSTRTIHPPRTCIEQMGDMYAAQTTGTSEWAPASHVDVMHSMHILTTSGTPIPPCVRLVCMTSEALSFPCEDPRRPRVRCIHWEMSPRNRSNRGQTGC